MTPKIAKSYRFDKNTIALIDKLVETNPEYASATHLIELLVYREAKSLGLVTNGNGPTTPQEQPCK